MKYYNIRCPLCSVVTRISYECNYYLDYHGVLYLDQDLNFRHLENNYTIIKEPELLLDDYEIHLYCDNCGQNISEYFYSVWNSDRIYQRDRITSSDGIPIIFHPFNAYCPDCKCYADINVASSIDIDYEEGCLGIDDANHIYLISLNTDDVEEIFINPSYSFGCCDREIDKHDIANLLVAYRFRLMVEEVDIFHMEHVVPTERILSRFELLDL